MSTIDKVDLRYRQPMAHRAKRGAGSSQRVGPAFEGGTGFLLSRTGSLARRSWTQMLAERGLTPHHYGMLMALGELGEPCGQQQLSDLIGIDSRNVVPIIDVLVDRGLLNREVDPADRRRRLLALTGSGHDMVRDLTETGAEIEDRFLQALGPADRKELHRLLLALLSPPAEPDADR